MGKLPRFNLFTLPARMRCFVYTVSRLETSPFGDTFYLTTDKRNKPSPEYIRVLPLFLTSCLFKSRVLRNKLLPTPAPPTPPSMIQIKKKIWKALH